MQTLLSGNTYNKVGSLVGDLPPSQSLGLLRCSCLFFNVLFTMKAQGLLLLSSLAGALGAAVQQCPASVRCTATTFIHMN